MIEVVEPEEEQDYCSYDTSSRVHGFLFVTLLINYKKLVQPSVAKLVR
jgi:hypothetical protein